MKFNLAPITANVSRKILIGRKNSPHLLFGFGIFGVIGSAIWACRSTLRFSESLDKIQNDINNVKGIKDNEDYPTWQYRRDFVYVYRRAAFEVVKLYGPPVALGAVSIVALTGSHVQLTKRNTAVMAAYAAMQKAYLDYRDRVREQYGEEAERDMYQAAKFRIKDESDRSKGLERVVKDPYGRSPYAKCFDNGASEYWQKDAESNKFFIDCQQNWANQKLLATGHVFLNEVYNRLGFPDTTAGAVVGWLKDGDGDGYIDFGMFDAINVNPNFLNGQSPTTWLDFNVDGIIYDLI